VNKYNINISNTDELIEEWDWINAAPTGRAVQRKLAHKQGIAHEGVHLWVIRIIDQPELLFQHRAKDKDTYPDCLDITVGGHVPFGRDKNKIQKESYEEIGIVPQDDELIDLGYYRYEEHTGDLDHREFQRIFLYQDNRPLNQYAFIDGEVDGIFAVKSDDLKRLMKEDFIFTVEGFEKDSLITKKVSRKDFHPLLFTQPMEEYMKVIFRAVTQLTSGKEVTVKMPLMI
jgi:isopentenyl-diphosphate Delta-isomerase